MIWLLVNLLGWFGLGIWGDVDIGLFRLWVWVWIQRFERWDGKGCVLLEGILGQDETNNEVG